MEGGRGGILNTANFDTLLAFLADIERLKLVQRRAWLSDLSRHENSAEHSWHMAVGLLTVARELNLEIDLPKALRMALVHDICEVDAGDISVYDPGRDAKAALERACIERMATYDLAFAPELQALWEEYEAQETLESRWVKVLDRLMPFLTNLMTSGATWREQGIARSQVLRINEPIRQQAPELFAWMLKRIDDAVAKGWLQDA
jgi:putative hydrolase of HD superfamily